MAEPGIRKRNLFVPGSEKPFRLSRSKLELFLDCPRCFYLDRRLGVSRPSGPAFTLNTAVDALLKKEFDGYRAQCVSHPCMIEHGIEAIPFAHEKLEEWRDSLHHGIVHPVSGTNLVVTGGVDDLWVNRNGALVIVDYKATSRAGEVTLDGVYQQAYKRQVEIYQWLFRKNGFVVDDVAYFVYCNGDAGRDRFDCRLEFKVKVLPYRGDDRWVDDVVSGAWECLHRSAPPDADPECDFCCYRRAADLVEKGQQVGTPRGDLDLP